MIQPALVWLPFWCFCFYGVFMRYAVDLINAIALADGTRRLREVLDDCRLSDDAFVILLSDLRDVLSEHLPHNDIELVINNLMRLMKEKR